MSDSWLADDTLEDDERAYNRLEWPLEPYRDWGEE